MFELINLFEIILIVYGLSLIIYFIDFIQHNRKVNKLAFWLLCIVLSLQTVYLLYKMIWMKSLPIGTLIDSLFFYSWILVLFSIIINLLEKNKFIMLVTNIVGFLILTLHAAAFSENNFQSSSIQFTNDVLITHVTLTIVSYGFFTLSFIFSLGYLVNYHLIKRKKQLKWAKKLGDLAKLDAFSFSAVTIGTPLLLIGLMLGFVWAFLSGDEFYWFDMKTIGSVIVFIVYILYLFLRLVKGYQGKSIAIFNTAAFLLLLVNFFLFSMLSNFHF
ncbi:cytochrome C assembly protein [Cerasibacillus terrae]|uniref:Cytochrome C assembly protein n=1 Tax=Cerasibacillus terrae TaxID=2498845 RepID=A0A5C8NNA7_9BACI|nr:cytochrome c biogenesis protein CcsA [Cerasibacillus terrae]TXL62567.1 cytochrome C assembly protein [Cerasibacillus terrae]